MSARKVEPAELLALYGHDLAILFAKMPQSLADAIIDELAAGIKEEADHLRAGAVHTEAC